MAEDLRTSFPATLELVLVSITFITVFGLLLGILAAHYRNSPTDNGLRLIAVLSVVSPTFVWAILLMLVFGFALGWFPISGRLTVGVAAPEHVTGLYVLDAALAGDWATMRDALYHIVLPGLALSLPAMGQTARLTRAPIWWTRTRVSTSNSGPCLLLHESRDRYGVRTPSRLDSDPHHHRA